MKLLSARLIQILLFSLILYSVSSPNTYSQFTDAALNNVNLFLPNSDLSLA